MYTKHIASILTVLFVAATTSSGQEISLSVGGTLYYDGDPAKWQSDMGSKTSALYKTIDSSLCSNAKQAMKKSNADIYNAWTACSLTKLTETGADSRITLYTKSLDPLQAKNDYQLLYANVRNALQSYAATKPANYYYGTVTRIGGSHRILPHKLVLWTACSMLSIVFH